MCVEVCLMGWSSSRWRIVVENQRRTKSLVMNGGLSPLKGRENYVALNERRFKWIKGGIG